jgi:sigma54-dependent transcription regulator
MKSVRFRSNSNPSCYVFCRSASSSDWAARAHFILMRALIAATNRDLRAMVGDQKFRPDLYHRLNVFPVRVPALRERPEDIHCWSVTSFRNSAGGTIA